MRAFLFGTRGRTRTGTGFTPTDFESVVSTNFTTLAAVRGVLCPLCGVPRIGVLIIAMAGWGSTGFGGGGGFRYSSRHFPTT